MKKHMMATVATTFAVLAMAIGSAGPAMATKSGLITSTGAKDMTWVMPDVDGMVLKHAMVIVSDVTKPVPLDIGTVAMADEPVLNQEEWVVCGQSPKKGVKISEETKKVTLDVERPGASNCA